jgi:hypothetical protein
MVVDYSSGSPRAALETLIKTGYANGAWTGNGITSASAAAAASSSHMTALGIAEATDIYPSLPATFKGQTVNSTSVLIRYTAVGDADLSGNVDLTDFTLLAANFNGSGKRWFKGDFNYDGSVDLTDFTMLASNFNSTVAGEPSAGIGAVVPEPTALVDALAGIALLSRRRRQII